MPHAAGNLLQVDIAPDLLSALLPLRARLRHLFDLDANPSIIESQLGNDADLAPYIKATPGLRIPGAIDGFEIALRAVLGQQISVKAASTIYQRFTEFFGESIDTPFAGLHRLAPTAATIADASLPSIIDRGLTRKRAETVLALARAVAEETVVLDPTAQRAEMTSRLLKLPGIGPWTAQYIAMRAMADPDAFPHSDLALLKAMQESRPAALLQRAERWQPWRAYAAMHIWNSLTAGG